MEGASFDISFTGTSIYISGSGTAGAYTTTLDGGEAVSGNPSGTTLASYNGLEYKEHTLSLKLTQGQQLNVSSALIAAGVGNQGATITEMDILAVSPGANSDHSPPLNSAYFSVNGPGQFSTIHDHERHPRVDTVTAGSTIHFRATNASAIFVYGSVNHDHGKYSVSLSSSGGDSSPPRTFSGLSKWMVYDSIIYWATGLDHTQTYTLSFTNLEQGKYFDISKIHVIMHLGSTSTGKNNTDSGSGSYPATQGGRFGDTARMGNTDPSNTSPSRILSTGAIAGIAAGGAVFGVLVLGLLFRCCRRRSKGRPNPSIFDDTEYPAFQDMEELPISSGRIVPFTLSPDHASESDLSPSRSRFNSFSSILSSAYAPGTGSFQSHGYQGQAHAFEAGTLLSSQTLPPAMDSRAHVRSPLGKSAQAAAMSSSPTLPPAAATRTPTVRQETDAGPVPVDRLENQDEILLPPGYNPAWSPASS
ncbi:hypothetical protein WG66_005474 [Moniliophthora roreri]|nr:hypothetical protein WG66_005474 [Moniliophthora roreri]